MHDLIPVLRLTFPHLKALHPQGLVTVDFSVIAPGVLGKGETPDGNRQIGLFGNVVGIAFRLQSRVQRRVVSQEAEAESTWQAVFFVASALSARHRIFLQTPDEDSGAGQVIAAHGSGRVDAAHVNRVSQPVKWAIEQIEFIHLANIGGAPAVEVRAIQ